MTGIYTNTQHTSSTCYVIYWTLAVRYLFKKVPICWFCTDYRKILYMHTQSSPIYKSMTLILCINWTAKIWSNKRSPQSVPFVSSVGDYKQQLKSYNKNGMKKMVTPKMRERAQEKKGTWTIHVGLGSGLSTLTNMSSFVPTHLGILVCVNKHPASSPN